MSYADEVTSQASDLLADLSGHIGDTEAICALMRRTLAELGPQQLGHVCAAALLTAFADCMTYIDPAMAPQGAIAYRNEGTAT